MGVELHNPSIDVPINMEKIPTLSRTSKLTLQEQIAEIMKERIGAGVFKPGEKLPSVRELAELFDVSRETAKLSLGHLSRQGYIEMIPSRGGFVIERHEEEEISSKKGTFGFVVDLGDGPQPPIAVDTIYENLLQFIDSQVNTYGKHLLTSYIIYGDPSGKERFKGIIEKVDGLFVTGLINPDLLQELRNLPVPVVSILSNLDVEKIDDVGLNSFKTFYKAAKHLIDTGHRKIAYLDGPKEYYQKERRIEGCRKAASEHTTEEVSFILCDSAGWSPDTAFEATLDLLNDIPDVDAVIGVNDVLAIGVLRACLEKGYRVPEDISIIGAKNTMLSLGANPSLSSIDYYFQEIARVAVKLMVERAALMKYQPFKIEMVGSLVERQSTKKKVLN